jgi:AMP-activated protein kinase-like protein
VIRRASLRISRLLLLMSLTPGPVAAQAQASLGLGLGSVRYPGGSRLSTAAAVPAFELASPNFTTSIVGSFAYLPQGIWSSQGRADVWISSPAAFGGVRLAVEGIGAGVTRTDGAWSRAASALGEVLYAGRSWGVALGAGPSAGWVQNEPSVTAFHGRTRLWSRNGAATYAASIEPTRFLGAWFTDVGAGVQLDARQMTVSLWGGARLSSTYGSKGAGAIALQYFVLPNVAIELGGGNYLPDPYQDLPRAGYLTAGVRLFTSRRSPPTQATAPVWSAPPLTPPRRGDSLIVRFRMEGARSVAIAGDWDGWQLHRLRSLGGDIWEGAYVLPSGTYHFDLQVDDRDWVVPSGVAVVKDRDGGMVAILLVK